MIKLTAISAFPMIQTYDSLGKVIVEAISENDIQLHEHDILCVASKIVSVAENRIVSLNAIVASKSALEIHKKVSRKDPRVIQAMIDETGASYGSQLEISENHIDA